MCNLSNATLMIANGYCLYKINIFFRRGVEVYELSIPDGPIHPSFPGILLGLSSP